MNKGTRVNYYIYIVFTKQRNILLGTLIPKINSSSTNWRNSSQYLFSLFPKGFIWAPQRKEHFSPAGHLKNKKIHKKKINQNSFKGTSLERWGRKGTFAKSLEKNLAPNKVAGVLDRWWHMWMNQCERRWVTETMLL